MAVRGGSSLADANCSSEPDFARRLAVELRTMAGSKSKCWAVVNASAFDKPYRDSNLHGLADGMAMTDHGAMTVVGHGWARGVLSW